jgi:hypothetical protein
MDNKHAIRPAPPIHHEENRPLDDLEVRHGEAVDGEDKVGTIEFATFAEGEYIESVWISPQRAMQLYMLLGTLLHDIAAPRIPQ